MSAVAGTHRMAQTVIGCVAPFGQWTRKMGGRECRGVRTVRYTYVRDLGGPGFLFDNKKDPCQLKNLAGSRDCVVLQSKLGCHSTRKLAEAHDEFFARRGIYPQVGLPRQ